MTTRRVTVQFGSMRVVVPCRREGQTVNELANAALARYKKAIGNTGSGVRVVRLECASDGGVLDPDDLLDDVFDASNDKILAIYDEGNGPVGGAESHYAQPLPVVRRNNGHPPPPGYGMATSSAGPSHYASTAVHGYQKQSSPMGPMSVVEVSGLEQPPQGLRVLTTSVSHERGGREWRSEELHYGAEDDGAYNSPMGSSYSAATTTTATLSGCTRNSPRSFELPKQHSLQADHWQAPTTSSSLDVDGQPVRSSLRSNATPKTTVSATTTTTATTPSRHRVTLSPEVEKRLAMDEQRQEQQQSYQRLQRGTDRKSKITDAFYEAQERLEEQQHQRRDDDSMTSSSGSRQSSQKDVAVKAMTKRARRLPLREGATPGTTVITFAPSEDDASTSSAAATAMGVDVTAVFDEESSASTTTASRLMAVQVMRMDDGGRVARDGRIRIGDNIVEIDGRPVYQMSILRARAYLTDLSTKKCPTLTVARPIESFANDDDDDGDNNDDVGVSKPIFSALQQANTQYIGHTTIVELVKSPNGFGFTVTGRETSRGERLFYIGTVKPNGVALGRLKAGDRLLEVNGVPTAAMSQGGVVDKLKEAMVGQRVRFLVSRVSPVSPVPNSTSPTQDNKENRDDVDGAPSRIAVKDVGNNSLRVDADSKTSPSCSMSPVDPDSELLDLVIPLNDTGSAGLGVSLKARVSVKSDGQRRDCGIFIKNVMHGGAVFKDGRVRINDRILGIEELDLERMSNQHASDVISKKLKAIGTNFTHVRLRIQRDATQPGLLTRDASRITVDAPSPSTSLLPSPAMSATIVGRSATIGGGDTSHSRHSSSSNDAATSAANRFSATSESSRRFDDSDLPSPRSDPFDREAVSRKSLSEKRGLGAAADPQHIRLFQDIKHQRQTSDLVNRRSLSMESINRAGSAGLHVIGAPKLQTTGQLHEQMQQHPFPPGSPILRAKSGGASDRSRDKQRRKSVGSAMRNFFGFGSKSRESSPEKADRRRAGSDRRKKDTPKSDLMTTSMPPMPPPHQLQMHQQQHRRGSESVYVDYGMAQPTTTINSTASTTNKMTASNSNSSCSSCSTTSSAGSPTGAPARRAETLSLSPTLELGNSRFYASFASRAQQLKYQQQQSDDREFVVELGAREMRRVPTSTTRATSTTDTQRIATTEPPPPPPHHRRTSTSECQPRTPTTAPASPPQRPLLLPPRRTDESPSTTTTTCSADTTRRWSMRLAPAADGRREESPQAVATTTTCSTRGSRAPVAAGPARFAPPTPPRRPFDGRPAAPAATASPAAAVASAGSAVAEELEALLRRRHSMHMLRGIQERSEDHQHHQQSARRPSSGATSAPPQPPPPTVPDPRQPPSSGSQKSRLLVFPTTRFVFASSLLRPTTTQPTYSSTFTSPSMPQASSTSSPTTERLSLRARKKRRAAVHSEMFDSRVSATAGNVVAVPGPFALTSPRATTAATSTSTTIPLPPTPTHALLPWSTSSIMSSAQQQDEKRKSFETTTSKARAASSGSDTAKLMTSTASPQLRRTPDAWSRRSLGGFVQRL